MTSVGVVGASARAAVHSLARAGHFAWAIDLFADRDLKRVAPTIVCPVDQYPDAISELAKQFPPGPVLYTGGLENYPHIIRELASQRELWGNPPEVVERVRDPFTLLVAKPQAAPVIPRGESCPSESRWLRKPLRSAGGLGIRSAHPGEVASPNHYFQEFIDGISMSALYCGTTLLGVTEQLIGEPWLHARPFAYCGNIGPVEAPESLLEARELALRGVWGIDFVRTHNRAVAVEVNPRYTAGVEVIEQATGVSVFRAPSEFSQNVKMGKVSTWKLLQTEARSATQFRVGKAIYYAPHAIRFPPSGPWDADLAGEFDPWRLPDFADIPDPGTRIEAGSPVLTFFAQGSTPAEVRDRLQSRASELDQLFRDSQP